MFTTNVPFIHRCILGVVHSGMVHSGRGAFRYGALKTRHSPGVVRSGMVHSWVWCVKDVVHSGYGAFRYGEVRVWCVQDAVQSGHGAFRYGAFLDMVRTGYGALRKWCVQGLMRTIVFLFFIINNRRLMKYSLNNPSFNEEIYRH